ncbi:MAG: diguanylate cyclase [Methylophaga sp.]
MPLYQLVFTLLLLGLSQLSQADSPVPPVIDITHLKQTAIREPAQFLVSDPAVTLENLPLEDFRPLTVHSINQGLSDQAFWIRFTLNNASEEAVSWILAHETSYIDHIHVFLRDNNDTEIQQFHLSDREPFSSRLLAHRTLAFPHTTPAQGSTEVYLQLYFDRADSVTLDFTLSESALFIEEQNREYLIYGLFYGAMLLLIMLSFLGAVLLRQWIYLIYTSFLIFSSLMWALLNGFAYQYLWPNSVFWHNEGFHIIYLLTAATAIFFSRQFLMTRLQFPRLDSLLKWLPLIFLAGVLLRFAGFYESVLYLAMLGISSLVLLGLLGLQAYRQGQVYARWYALAWLVYSCGLALSVIAALTSFLPWGMSSLAYAQLGAIIEAIMLLMALGDKIRHWERDHQQIRQLVQQDPLTGIGNRRLMPEALNSMYKAFRHNRKPVFMALLDLDHFKPINDSYGHEAGDQVIKYLANLMQSLSRSEDVCIRQGGDEFLLLFQANNRLQAIQKIDRLRRAFCDKQFQFDGGAFTATLSAGISLLFSSEQSVPEQTAFRHADHALYQAKQAGGNQCLFYHRDQAPQDELEKPSASLESNPPHSS